MAGTSDRVQEMPKLHVLRDYARDELAKRLELVNGMKDLVLDAELMRPLDRIAGASLLKIHNIDKIYKLDSGKPLSGLEKRIYLVRPNINLTQMIANQINAEVSGGQKRQYIILFVPRKLHACEMLLEREGVMGHVKIYEYPLDLIPLDRDLLSLEMPKFYRSLYLDGDQTWLHTVTQSVINIQRTYGTFPNVYRIGRCSQMVYEMLNQMTELESEPSHLRSQIGHLFLIDRDCDYVTPLCSQVTYEGLLDDTFEIQSGFVEFGPEVAGQDQKAKLLLTSEDEMYEEIRNRHFSNVSIYLSAKAKELQAKYDNGRTLNTVASMKDFVSNDLRSLKNQHKSLALHVGACELINKSKMLMEFEDQLHTEHNLLEGVETKDCISFVEELINKQDLLSSVEVELGLHYTKFGLSSCKYKFSMPHTLRLLCLLSVTQGGLPSQTSRSLKTQFLQSYGFDKLLLFENLRRVGLYTESDRQPAAKPYGSSKPPINVALSFPFRSLIRKLNLIPKSADEINLRNPNDMSYVFSGAYAPLSCRLVEQVLSNEGFGGLDDIVRLLPTPALADCKAKSAKSKESPPSSRVVMVYFLGGCTYSEIAALRFLGKQRGFKFLIATTSTGNSLSLINSLH